MTLASKTARRSSVRAKARDVNYASSARLATGLSQASFAERFGIPLGTIRDWEQGRTQPEGPARAFLKVIAAEPGVVQRALALQPRTNGRHPEPGSLEFYLSGWSAEHDDDDLANFQFRLMIILVAQIIQSEFRALCRSLNISESEMRILLRLRRSHTSLRPAAQNIQIWGSITKKIEKLEKRQLVRRASSRKEPSIELTEKGSQLVSKAHAEQFMGFSLSAPAFRLLSRRNRADGLRFLRAISVAMLTVQASQKKRKSGQRIARK